MFLLAICPIVLLVPFDPIAAIGPIEDGPPRVRLVLQTKDFMIHAYAPSGIERKRFPLRRGPSAEHSFVLHTATRTGEMKILAMGSLTVVTIPMGIDRTYQEHIYVAGVAADKERTYVLLVTNPGWRQATLRIFRSDTGAPLHSAPVTVKEKSSPPETSGAGPLTLLANGVEAYGARFEFKGTELIKPLRKE